MDSFMFLIKSSLHLLNRMFIEESFDIEDKCAEIAYQKKSQKELEEFINKLNKDYL